MTISRAELDRHYSATDLDNQSADSPTPQRFVPPFYEPIYTVNEAAKILRLSPEQVRTIFRNQPGVHDLSADTPKSRFLKRKSQLRIPHAVLVSFWKRTEMCQQQPNSSPGGRRTRQ